MFRNLTLIRFYRYLKHQKFSFASIIFLILGFFAFFGTVHVFLQFITEPKSTVQNLLISNASDTSLSLAWTTESPTRGMVIISEKENFPFLPVLAGWKVKDDGEKSLKRSYLYTAHHVTVSDLLPGKKYYFRIYQGFHLTYAGQFTTLTSVTLPNLPSPQFGKIVQADGKSPAVGVIVFFQIEGEKHKSTLASTLTNLQGNWMVDLSNLRSEDGKGIYQVAKKDVGKVVVEAGSRGRYKNQRPIEDVKPWPTIILKSKQ